MCWCIVLVLLLNKLLHCILLVQVFGLLSKLANLTKIHYSANCHRDTIRRFDTKYILFIYYHIMYAYNIYISLTSTITHTYTEHVYNN